MKNKFKYIVHRWIDIGFDQFPKSLISKLEGLDTYKDQVIKEHLYSIDNLKDHCQENGIFLNNEEQNFIQIITDWQTKEDQFLTNWWPRIYMQLVRIPLIMD